jgi:hypothetical protein
MSCGLCERELRGDQAEHHLCSRCARAAAERLERMPRLYDALAAFLQPSGRRPELGRTPRDEAPLPLSEPVLSLRGPGGIVGVLEDWHTALWADLGWGEPRRPSSIGARVGAAAAALGTNLLWIASSWPAAGDFARELRNLEAEVLSIVDPPERTVRLGHCPAVYEDGVICGAVLRVPPGAADVHCRWCGATYPPGAWLSLAAAQAGVDAAAARPSHA